MVERASGGTLFLDEVTEMSADMQTRLLRFLETRRFFRVGGTQEIRTDVRVVAATNRSPVQAVRDGSAARGPAVPAGGISDRAGAAARAWRGCGAAGGSLPERDSTRATALRKCSAAARRQTLREYRWPGNVRELKNAIERAYILCEQELELQPMNLHALSGDARRAHEDADGGIRVPIGSSLAQAERWLIEATLAHWAGQQESRRQDAGMQPENAV